MLKLFIMVGIVAVIGLVFSVGRSFMLAGQSKLLVKNAVLYERKISSAPMRILVLGDSTAFGVGAENADFSTAGRLGNLYPEAEVVNLSVSGLKIGGLNKILLNVDDSERFDIVLIQIGANDIIRFTSNEEIEMGIKAVLQRAGRFGGKVIVLHSGDVGGAKFFPWFARPFLTHKSQEVRGIYIRVVGDHNASYVDLMSSPADTLLLADPPRYYAKDYLHLSGEGYGLWFDEIKKAL
jgi:lysophospholipase L1-like esterase